MNSTPWSLMSSSSPLPVDMTDRQQEVATSEDRSQSGNCGEVSPPSLKRACVQDAEEDHKHAGKQRRASPRHVETFEAEGQMLSPGRAEGRVDWDAGLGQLRYVCGRLGVGCHGYLSEEELGQVCRYIGMDPMNPQELRELFLKLDVDGDNLISFDEFVQGLSLHTSLTSPTLLHLHPLHDPPLPLHPLSGRKVRTLVPPAQQEKMAPLMYSSVGTVNLFSSLPSAQSGFASWEEIVDYWEKLNIPHGADLLVQLGFAPGSRLSLRELSEAVSSQWCGPMAELSPLGHVLTATYHHELTVLSSGLDQTKGERDKLRSDLTDALARNALLAAEVDERHSQLEKSFNAQLQRQDQDHQDQVRHWQSEAEREHQAGSAQAALLAQSAQQVTELQHKVTTLTQQLESTQQELCGAQRDLSQARDRQSEVETQCNTLTSQLHKALQSQPDSPNSRSWEAERQSMMARIEHYGAENKDLKDRCDELVSQLEVMQHRTQSSHRSSHRCHGQGQGQGRSASTSRIPVRNRASSFSSDTSEWDDEDSASEALYSGQPSRLQKHVQNNSVPSLSVELQQHRRRSRSNSQETHPDDGSSEGERTPTSHRQAEKKQMWEQFQREVKQKLGAQRREMAETFNREKEDMRETFNREKTELSQQWESRLNLRMLEHREQTEGLEKRLKQAERHRDKATNLYTKTRVEEAERDRNRLQGELTQLRQHYETELQNLRAKYDDDVAKVKATQEQRVQQALERVFDQGAGSLKGRLKEDFDHLVQTHRHDNDSQSSQLSDTDREQLYAAFEREKAGLMQHYEGQLESMQEEVSALQQHFEAERAAFHQLQSGHMAQAISQDLQAARRLRAQRIRAKLFPMDSITEQEDGGGGLVVKGWEAERRELQVQNQLLQEELVDLKGALVQERQRVAESHSLRETVRRLKADNREAQSLAEDLKDRMSRMHQQQDLERANFERRIDRLQRDKDKALRVQALTLAGSQGVQEGEAQRQVLQKVLQQVLKQVPDLRCPSPHNTTLEQGSLDQLQGQITLLTHQLQEARTAQLEFQQLKEQCEMLQQTNSHLEEMVRVLRQRADKDLIERDREDQDELHDMWEEKTKLQNMMQRATDRLLKTSAEMAAGQTQLVREVDILKQKAGNMNELDIFTGLQVSLLETQRHSISLQEALTTRTQLADRILADTEKEHRRLRDGWEQQKQQLHCQLSASTEMYRNLMLQHKALRQCSSRVSQQLKTLHQENADLSSLLQHTHTLHSAAQQKANTLQHQCQAWHDVIRQLMDSCQHQQH